MPEGIKNNPIPLLTYTIPMTAQAREFSDRDGGRH